MNRSLVLAGLRWSGGMGVLRWMRRQGLRILMYHRFAEETVDGGALARQCEHFRRHYRVLSLDEAAGYLARREPFPAYSLALTVDDGYRDVLGAHAVFERFAIPVTVYLATDFLDGQAWLWTDLVRYCFAHGERRKVDIPFAGGTAGLESAGQFNRLAKTLPDQERRRLVVELPRLLGVDVPVRPPASEAPLTWDEVRTLAGRGVTFGAHTVTHPILSQLETRSAMRQEIGGSKERIEAQLGRPVRHFCYPNGQPEDLSAEVLAVTAECGFATAVTTSCGVNTPQSNPLQLLRFGMEPGLTGFYFETVTAGWRKTG